MIILRNAKQKESNKLNEHGIKHVFFAAQIFVNVELSADVRVNEALAGMVKKLTGRYYNNAAYEIKCVQKMDFSINIIIEEAKNGTDLVSMFDLFISFLRELTICQVVHNSMRFASYYKLNLYNSIPAIKLDDGTIYSESNNGEDMIKHGGLVFSFQKEKLLKIEIKNENNYQQSLDKIRGSSELIDRWLNEEELTNEELLWVYTNAIEFKALRTLMNERKRRDRKTAIFIHLAKCYNGPLSYQRVVGDGKFEYQFLSQAINNRLQPTMRIKDTETITKVEGRLKLKQHLIDYLESNKKEVWLLKADTGIGKSHTVAELARERVLFILPTKKLGRELKVKVENKHQNLKVVMIDPVDDKEIPDCSEKEEMFRARQKGLGKQASDYRNKAIEKCDNEEIKTKHEKYKQALSTKQAFFIITHKRFADGFLEAINPPEVDSIIIDEDPVNEMLTDETYSTEVLLYELNQLIATITAKGFGVNAELNEVEEEIVSKVKKFMELVQSSRLELTPNSYKPFFQLNSNKLAAIIMKNPMIKNNLFAALESDCLISHRNKKNELETTCTSSLLTAFRHKKIMIMSATLNKKVHMPLFLRHVNINTNWIEIPPIETKGKVILFADRSTSKTALKNTDLGEVIKEIIKPFNYEALITNKNRKYLFEDNKVHKQIHFGNCAGYDELNGKNIVVVGTPSLPPWKLALLTYQIFGKLPRSTYYNTKRETIDFDFKMQKMEESGYQFAINTFTHPEDYNARVVHLWQTSSDIEQAVGRARLIDNDCTVYVFSRIPVKQCKIKKYLEIA
ncbi:hypothetical protein NDK43_06755 [Neobacillus pocheonensis]|uniref:Helicase ATP-binding domain-containing protein n=1 Tax=Neobacillus pocheonensis TaxID=363869 RepID=A0ABT0W7U9_9BACI|nr:hypothetical protein [Neobacillus pocheonensis]